MTGCFEMIVGQEHEASFWMKISYNIEINNIGITSQCFLGHIVSLMSSLFF